MSSSKTRRNPRVRSMGRTELTCQFCEKIFFKSDHLSRHERSHTKERPFYCEPCDKYFSRHDTLLRHMKKIHDAANTDVTGHEISSQIITECSPVAAISARETEALNDPSEFNATTSLRLYAAENETINGAGQTIALESRNAELPPPDFTFLDQYNWMLDCDLDLNSLQMPFLDHAAYHERSQNRYAGNGGFNDPQRGRGPPGNDIQKAWFTYMNSSKIPYASQEGALDEYLPLQGSRENNYDLDQDFRMIVTKKLTIQPNNDPLPSTGLLKLSKELYFRDFARLFPVIHRHTFNHSAENSVLLLSMCSIGSLVAGEVANHHGVKIFERLRGNIMALWDATFNINHSDAIPLVQAAVLSQVFGLLSGVPKHFLTVDSFHGTLISWARRCNMFLQTNSLPDLVNIEGTNLEETWKSWAKSEEQLRAVMSLYILDAQIASIFHHDPILRYDSIASYVAADDDVFDAPTSWDWKAAVLKKSADRQPPSPTPAFSCQFTSYLVLQGINATICQEQIRGRLETSSTEFNRLSDDLMIWRRRFDEESVNKNNNTPADALGLVILWHSAFMRLMVDFGRLERALGRDGHQTEHDLNYAVSWSISVRAERCILHAYEIQQKLSNMRLDSEPALHVPHSAFLVGIASYSCLRFRRPEMLTRYPQLPRMIPRLSLSDFPEFNMNGESSINGDLPQSDNLEIMFENERGELFMRTATPPQKVMQVGADIFRGCYDMLCKMGHFDAARSYAKVMKALIHDEIEEWMDGS